MGQAIKHPRFFVLVLTAAFVAAALVLPQPIAGRAAGFTAIPTAAPLLVDGKSIPCNAYNIEGYNYFLLQDLAIMLNGGLKSFDFSIERETQAILLAANHGYTQPADKPMPPGSGIVTPQPTETKVFLDGLEIQVTAYIIGENTYFKLRDIALALDFAIGWDARNGSILIDTGLGYGQVIPLAQLPEIPKKLGVQELGAAPNEAALGIPRRILNESASTQVRIYGNYSHFTLLCVSNGQVVYIYINYDASGQQADTLYTDSLGGGKVYGAASGNMPILDLQTTGQVLFELTNAFRGYHGLEALRWNNTLTQVADKHSRNMAQQNFFGHQGLDGSTTSSRLEQAGYNFLSCAENILAGYNEAFEPFDSLVHSANHRKNLLTATCDETGISWVKAAQGTYTHYATQVFGKE